MTISSFTDSMVTCDLEDEQESSSGEDENIDIDRFDKKARHV